MQHCMPLMAGRKVTEQPHILTTHFHAFSLHSPSLLYRPRGGTAACSGAAWGWRGLAPGFRAHRHHQAGKWAYTALPALHAYAAANTLLL